MCWGMSAPPDFLENFYLEYMLNFVICFFCIHWYNHMMFTLRFVEVGYYVDWFDEPSLFPWNKSHVITLVCCWGQFDNILLRILKSIWFDTGVATWFWGVVVVWCYFCCPCCLLVVVLCCSFAWEMYPYPFTFSLYVSSSDVSLC